MARYGLFQVADVTFYDLVTGKPLIYLNTLKISNIENKAQTVYAQGGKGNAKIVAFDKTKEANIKIQDALIVDKTLALMVGNKTTTGATTVDTREELVSVAGSGGTTSEVTLGGTLSSLTAVFATDDTGMVSTDISNKATVTTTAGSTVLSFATTDVPVGTKLFVYYVATTGIDATVYTITANDFPPYVRVVGQTTINNTKTGLDEKFTFVVPKAKISPNFTLTLQADGNPTVFDMDLEAFITDESNELYHLIKH